MVEKEETMLSKVLQCISVFCKEINLPENVVCINTDWKDDITDRKPEPEIQKLSKSLQDILAAPTPTQIDPAADPSLVQITATKQELDKRIAAFIAHAQHAVDEQNIRDFRPTGNSDDGCARTNALYKRRANRTHMEVKQVDNTEGPQTCTNYRENVAPTNSKSAHLHPGVHERLQNLEDHVGVIPSSLPRDVYERLKAIENRVLHLESVSPEYFERGAGEEGRDVTASAPKRARPSGEEPGAQMSIDEIDDRIRSLKSKLLGQKAGAS